MILRRDESICDEYPCIQHEWITPFEYGFDAVGELVTVVAQVPYNHEYEKEFPLIGGEVRTKERMKVEVFTSPTMYHIFRHYTNHQHYSDNGSLIAE